MRHRSEAVKRTTNPVLVPDFFQERIPDRGHSLNNTHSGTNEHALCRPRKNPPMMIQWLRFVFLAVLLAGCSHVRTVDSVGAAETGAYISEINTRAQRQPAIVVLTEGESIKANALQITPESVSWLDSETGQMREVATSEVQEIRFVRRSRGVLQGLGLGALIGAGVGSALGYAGGDGFLFSAEESALVVGLLGSAVAAAVGIVAGLDGASQDRYRLTTAEQTGIAD